MIIQLLVVIAVVGFLLWLVTTFVPMPAPFKQILVGVACLLLVLYLLQGFGVLGPLPRWR